MKKSQKEVKINKKHLTKALVKPRPGQVYFEANSG